MIYPTNPEEYVGIYLTKKEAQKEIQHGRRVAKRDHMPPSLGPRVVFVQPMGCLR